MLLPYNILYPHFYGMIENDDYIKTSISLFQGQEGIINENTNQSHLGQSTIPAIIVSVSGTEFIIEDIFGVDITNTILSVFIGTSWIQSTYTSPILMTDDLFIAGKKRIYVKVPVSDSKINRTVFGSINADIHILSKNPVDKYNFFINTSSGVSMSGETEETVLVIDIPQMSITTDAGVYNLKHSDFIQTLSVSDIIPKFTMLDQVASCSLLDGFLSIQLKRDFSYLNSYFRGDVNIRIELVD